MTEVVIDPRFRGPDASGNGGYSCGLFARASGVDRPEVTLRLPPPLGVPLRVQGGRVFAGEVVVADVARADGELDSTEPPSWEEALEAEEPDFESPFPNCFVCGHARGEDGLHIHAGPWRDGAVAATWVPRSDTAREEFVWAALDCPGAYATGALRGRGVVVLGRFAARVVRVPAAGERCVVVGWPIGSDGRKHLAGTALHTSGGELLAVARATWIEPRGS